MKDAYVKRALKAVKAQHGVDLKKTFLDTIDNPAPILRSMVNIAMNWHSKEYDCWRIGKGLQGTYNIPYQTELEVSAGFWYLIYEGKIK